MNVHRRAKTCPESRELLARRMVEEAWPTAQACAALGISVRTGFKWLSRYRHDGPAGLLDRSSRPRRVRQRLDAATQERVLLLRRERRLPARAFAEEVQAPRATVGRLLRRHGLSRARDLEPREPVRRDEKTAPGELLHLDVKTLGRIAERFIQTARREWSRRRPCESSAKRQNALTSWIRFYNHRRRQDALGRLSPVARLNNLVSSNT